MTDERPVEPTEAQWTVDALRDEVYRVMRALQGRKQPEGVSEMTAQEAQARGLMLLRPMMDNWMEFCDDIDLLLRAAEEYADRCRREAGT